MIATLVIITIVVIGAGWGLYVFHVGNLEWYLEQCEDHPPFRHELWKEHTHEHPPAP